MSDSVLTILVVISSMILECLQAKFQELLAGAHLLQADGDRESSPKRLACHVTLLRELINVAAFGPLQAGTNHLPKLSGIMLHLC